MRVIKFKLNSGWNMIETENHCQPLWIEFQDTGFVVWCKEYTGMPTQKPLELLLAVTGEEIPDYAVYVGTATTPEKLFVVHLFQA